MPDVKYEFVRGNSSGIDGTSLKDGQILFDKQKKTILLDASVNGTLTRINMSGDNTFNGTAAEWEALTDAQRAAYKYVYITDDYEVISKEMEGASATTNGVTGLVPQPIAGDQDKVLYGDGTWKTPSIDYEDVTNTPDLGTAAEKNSTSAVTEDSTDLVESGAVYDALTDKVNASDLADVATSGDYEDLINTPTLGTAAAADTTSSVTESSTDVLTSGGAYTALASKVDSSDLADVATSGDYEDLINTPTLGTAAAADTTDSVIENSTDVLTSGGAYTALANIDTMISGIASGLDWKEAVATFDDIATTYPNPDDGWTVNVKDTDYTYRYDGSHWVAISANAIPQATTSVNGLMTTTQVTKLNGIATGAEVNVQADWNVTDNTSDAFIKNKPTIPSVTDKADKVANATSGNFAGLDSNGNLTDSGKKSSDFLTSHQDISGKADKVSNATANNFAGLDSSGNLIDSGKKASDFLTSHQDISGKADKVSSATNGNFAGLNASGNLTDSGKKASDFAAASHNQASNTINAMTGYSKASTADQPVSTSDSLNTAIGKLEKTLDGKTSNTGTITEITMNGSSKGTSGVVNLGTVITAHQDISGKADKSATVSNVAWDSTNKKLTKTINGTTSDVVTGTNPHGTTKSDIGLGNVGNFLAVSTVASQGLSDTQKSNARANIGAGTSNFSGNYNDLTNKPTIPTVNNATLTIQKNGTDVKTFTANASSNVTANITVPTKTSDLTNDSGYTTFPIASKTLDANYKTQFRTETKGNTSSGEYISTIRTDTSGIDGLPQYGSGLASGRGDTHMYLYTNYNGDGFYVGGGNADKLNWVSRVYTSNNKPSKSDVGLGNVENKSSATIRGELTSSNVTTALGFTPGTGTVTSVNVGSTSYSPSSGVVSLPSYPTVPSAASSAPGDITTGTASAGSSGNYARQDHTHKIATATTSAYGATKLNDATNSTSTTEAATANAVKKAYDLANSKGTGTVTSVKVGSTSYNPSNGVVSLPAYPTDTNNAVTQTATTTSANYEVLFSSTADNTTRTEGARKNSNLTFNPNTGNLQATQLNGVTIGSSPKFTDSTYTFASGTNGFTVTPSGGSAQTVAVTPSITNNVTGSGTSGYIAKFNGANTITNGPAFGSDTTKFLRNDGTWNAPPVTSVSLGDTGTASATAVKYQRVGVNGSYTTVRGTMYMESSNKLTANDIDTFTFTNSNITTSAVYDFYADVYGVAPTEIGVSSGSMIVKFKSSDGVTTCRVYIK